MRDLLPLDIKKIKEEDRRLLLNKSLSEIITSHSGSMHNTAMTLSLLAILISTFSMVYSTKNIFFIIIFAVLSLIGLIFYISKLKKNQENLKKERETLKKDYDELFKHHFAYATKSIK